MHARLQDGPGAGTKGLEVGDPPPQLAFFFAGGPVFPANIQRYELAGVNRTPPAEATYKHKP